MSGAILGPYKALVIPDDIPGMADRGHGGARRSQKEREKPGQLGGARRSQQEPGRVVLTFQHACVHLYNRVYRVLITEY